MSISAYYAFINANSSSVYRKKEKLKVLIRAAHKQSRETYSAVRLYEKIVAEGINVSLWKVKQLRREMGLRCKQHKKFKKLLTQIIRCPWLKISSTGNSPEMRVMRHG